MSKLFVPFIMAGDPSMDDSILHLKTLEEAGADKIEIGIPYSDPVADGPIIQAAAGRALMAGFDLEIFLNKLKEANIKTPLILFTYLNPIFRYGIERFTKESKELSFESLLLLDLPLSQSAEIRDFLQQNDLSLIHLVTPTTSAADLEIIEKESTSFIYYMTRKGVTGTGEEQNSEEMMSTQKVKSKVPVIAGFGIDGPDKAKEVAKDYDGIIIGSAIVDLLAKQTDRQQRLNSLTEFAVGVKKKLGELC